MTKDRNTSITVKYPFILVGILLFQGCSSRTTPAPVINLSSGQTIEQQKIHKWQSKYRVQKGDTLYSIAFRADKDFREVAQLNAIKAPYTIFPGQVLVLKSSVKEKPKKVEKRTNPISSKQNNNKKLKSGVDPVKKQEYVENQTRVKNEQKYTVASNKLKWQWPAAGSVGKRFSNKENGYKGIQIKNKRGTAILAAADGQVVYAGSALRGYGELVIVKHNDDYLTAYAHNQKLLVKEKQYVSAGQKIAEMGNTDSDEVALRFEVRFKGKSVNPKAYLPNQ